MKKGKKKREGKSTGILIIIQKHQEKMQSFTKETRLIKSAGVLRRKD